LTAAGTRPKKVEEYPAKNTYNQASNTPREQHDANELQRCHRLLPNRFNQGIFMSTVLCFEEGRRGLHEFPPSSDSARSMSLSFTRKWILFRFMKSPMSQAKVLRRKNIKNHHPVV